MKFSLKRYLFRFTKVVIFNSSAYDLQHQRNYVIRVIFTNAFQYKITAML